MSNVDVDRARIAVARVAPELLEQHVPAEHLSRPRHNRAEDLELDVGELDRLTVDLDRPASKTDYEAVRRDPLGVEVDSRRHRRAAEQCAHAAAKLPDRERLGDVV